MLARESISLFLFLIFAGSPFTVPGFLLLEQLVPWSDNDMAVGNKQNEPLSSRGAASGTPPPPAPIHPSGQIVELHSSPSTSSSPSAGVSPVTSRTSEIFLPTRHKSVPIPLPSISSAESDDDNSEKESTSSSTLTAGEKGSQRLKSLIPQVSNTQLYELDQPEVFIDTRLERSGIVRLASADRPELLPDDDQLYELNQPQKIGSQPVLIQTGAMIDDTDNRPVELVILPTRQDSVMTRFLRRLRDLIPHCSCGCDCRRDKDRRI